MTTQPKLDAITETVLRRYYLDDASKVEIGQELGLSRFKVARIIQEAKRLGHVRIEITPAAADSHLSEALRRTLGLRRALVVPHTDGLNDASHRQMLASLGAQLVTEVAGTSSVVGFASTQGLIDIGDAIDTLHDCTVVQLNGVPSHDLLGQGPVELVRSLAAKTTKNGRTFYAPFVVEDAQTAVALRRDPMTRSVMAKYPHLDLAVVSVGAMRTGMSAWWDAADEAERSDITARGGVGEICGVAFDANGEYLETSLTRRTIAISANDLAQVNEVIAVISTYGRSEAVYAAAKAKWITCLVTSDVIAKELLAMAERAPSGRGAR